MPPAGAEGSPPPTSAGASVPSGQIPPYTGSAAPQQAPNLTTTRIENPIQTTVAANSTPPEMSAKSPDLTTPPPSDLPQLASPPITVAEAPEVLSPPPIALEDMSPSPTSVLPPPGDPVFLAAPSCKVAQLPRYGLMIADSLLCQDCWSQAHHQKVNCIIVDPLSSLSLSTTCNGFWQTHSHQPSTSCHLLLLQSCQGQRHHFSQSHHRPFF